MGTVLEDQLDGLHKNVTFTSDGGEDGDSASCVTKAGNLDGERNIDEFSQTNSRFESKGDERPTEKEFGSFGSISTVHEEAAVAQDDEGGCCVAFEREVGTAECPPIAVDTCGAGGLGGGPCGWPSPKGCDTVQSQY
ncbi:hypothetical protein HPB50_019620 [Hyalomma asiaticum]|uniref:Uncharacterized protein n=1 Tax=Hyalomma asiaticum TaxID=266040 RepID=A0ACB7RRY4_HYAAI|nr:hypothetical protein HPB50_019620 [Hyalomma asiaticum]